jgi:uncharacterized membrane protein YhaH (DUF805 family)
VTIYIVTTVIGMIAIMPMVANSMRRMWTFAITHPEQSAVMVGPGRYSVSIRGSHPDFMPNMDAFIGIVAGVAIITISLLSAAVVRRLHDRDRSGRWGLMPLPFLGFAMFGMHALFRSIGDGAAPIGLFSLLFLNNLVYLASVVTLIVMLARAGTIGPNSYGPDPQEMSAA